MPEQPDFTACLRFAPLLLLLAAPPAASGQTGENVLVVVNSAVQASGQIGEHYARKRVVPSDQVLRLTAPPTEQISRADYERTIEAPIAAWLARTGRHDRILYIVLTKGIPLRIVGTGGMAGTLASVDSELTLLYRKLAGARSTTLGRVNNPYFAASAEPRTFKPFTHEAHDIFLVTRLDGFTVADVLALVDRGAAPSRDGRIVLDQRASLVDRGGDQWLERASTRLADAGFTDRVVLETSTKVVPSQTGVLGYYSWGSNDSANTLRRFGMTFNPGAIGGMFVSSDGRTFAEPPAAWAPGGDSAREHFAGTPQSLAGDLIRDGITGVSAHVAEPYLDAAVRPEVLFPAYLAGFNLAEAYYLAMPFLSWQTIVVGDPLCAPFRAERLAERQIEPGIDPTTELPRHFSERVVKALTRPGGKPEAAALLVRAQTRIARADRPGAAAALEQSIALDGGYPAARRLLGVLSDELGQHEKAIAQYRAALALAPNDQLSLNNLAYSLAVHAGRPQEALTFATRAYRSAAGDPNVVDTLAWIHHLLGNDKEAAQVIAPLAGRDTGVGEIHLHAAIILAAVGNVADARAQLDRALKVSPDLAQTKDVADLRAKLGAP